MNSYTLFKDLLHIHHILQSHLYPAIFFPPTINPQDTMC